ANMRANTICCWGPSTASRPASVAGEPMTNVPAGATTISGQASHSLKASDGLRALSLSGDSNLTGGGVRGGTTAVGRIACTPATPAAFCSNAAMRASTSRLRTLSGYVVTKRRKVATSPASLTTSQAISSADAAVAAVMTAGPEGGTK